MNFKLTKFALCSMMAITPSVLADNLLEIYNKALENDPTLRAAEASFKANIEQENLSKSVLLPQLNLGANWSTSSYDSDDFTTASDSYGWNVSVSQTIFDATSWFNFRSAENFTEGARAQFSADQQSLIVRTVDAYLGVLRAISNLDTSRAEEAALQRQYEQAQQRFEVGLIAITDVYEARASLDNVIATRIQLEGQVGIAFEQLEILTGQPESAVAPLVEDFPIVAPSPESSSPWVTTAMENNFDLKVSYFNMQSAEESSKATTWQRGPSVGLTASYGDSTQDQSDPIDLDASSSDGWSASVNFSMPIYNGGSLSASNRQAAEKYNQAKENYIGAQRNVTQQARANYLSAITGVATVEARHQAIISSESSLDATQAGYEVGTRNIVDVLNTQQALFRARSNYSNARFDYILSMLELKQVAGTLSPNDIHELNKWLDVNNQLNRFDVTDY